MYQHQMSNEYEVIKETSTPCNDCKLQASIRCTDCKVEQQRPVDNMMPSFVPSSNINSSSKSSVNDNDRKGAPSPNDVVCARGRSYWNHPGNRMYRKLIAMAKTDYLTASNRFEKSVIVSKIMDAVHDKSGVFVKKVVTSKSNDGDGVSPGVMPSDGVYKVRVRGDRTWSFADQSFNWEASGWMDLIYSFNFNDASNPTEAVVYGGGGNALSIVWKGVTYAIEFGMELQTKAQVLAGPNKRYNTSVVWERPSRFLGTTLASYTVVQVMDENGNKIEPAFSEWVAYNQHPTDTGNTPDTIFWFEAQ